MKIWHPDKPGSGDTRRSSHFLSPLVLVASVLVCLVTLPSPAQQAPTPGTDADSILEHLSAAIGWYRHLASMDATAGSPGDALYLQNARTAGVQALEAAFQSARDEAALLLARQNPAALEETSGQTGQDQQNVAKAAADVAARINQTESRIDALNKRIRNARGKTLRSLTDERDTLLAEIDLDKALQENLGKIEGYINSSETTGLTGKINALKASVPELGPQGAPGAKPPAREAPKSDKAYASGSIGQASVLFARMGDVRSIDGLLSETTRLRNTVSRLQAPLRDSLRGLLHEGRDAVNQPALAGQAGNTRQALAAITTQFKQVGAAALPLRQEAILLDQVQANLLEWRKSVEREYGLILRSLLTRVLVILVALALVMLLSEVWRRATYRYVREVRRRRQVLLLRRFVTGFSMVIVIILGFVSEFSSLATFAGFLTAGLAVALQTVILSVAAYFFLIGRYGVRVGDRITISGVTGDVIDIGLVRLYLLELSGTGINLYPTGRVVVFSNSVLFQTSPLFKQIPGTAYTWHEAVVPLVPGADHVLAEEKLLDAVNDVYARISPRHRTTARRNRADHRRRGTRANPPGAGTLHRHGARIRRALSGRYRQSLADRRPRGGQAAGINCARARSRRHRIGTAQAPLGDQGVASLPAVHRFERQAGYFKVWVLAPFADRGWRRESGSRIIARKVKISASSPWSNIQQERQPWTCSRGLRGQSTSSNKT